MQIFAGSASQKLGGEVAELLGVALGRVELGKFSNGETRIRILEEKVEKEVVVIQSLSAPADHNLMELCLITDALTRMGATSITAVIPWLSYSKQDKVFLPGEALGVKVVAKIIAASGIKHLITLDLHNRAILGFFDIPVTELSAKPLLLEYFRKSLTDKSLVVAPDAGAVKSATSFAYELGLDVVYVDKKRDLVTGEVKIVGMSRSVASQDVIVVDDNLFTGSTVIELSKELKEAGAKTIRVGLTHHMYIPQVDTKIEASEIDELVVSDSVEEKSKVTQVASLSRKTKVLSIAGMIARHLTQ